MKLFGQYSKLKNKHLLILLLFLLAPVIWSLIFQPTALISEVIKTPQYIKVNLSSIFARNNLRFVEEMRWNAFGEQKNELLSTLLYNKASVMLNKSFDLLSLLSPRLFFQSGDGTQFSPKGIEPIAGVLVIFWFSGIYQLLKTKKYRIIYLIPITALPAFIAGQRNMVFLFPLLIVYLYIAFIGLNECFLRASRKHQVVIPLFIYGLFLMGRWLFV